MPAGRKMRELVQGVPLGHPSHPLFVHFPTALYPAALAFGIFSNVQNAPVYGKAATLLLVGGVAAVIPAAVTGLVDWWGMAAGSTKRQAATRHMLVQLSAQALAAVALVLHLLGFDAGIPPIAGIVVLGAATLLMAVGNFLGGILVYRMGMRVSTRS